MAPEKRLIDADELLLNIRTTIARNKAKYANNPIISSVLDGFDELVMGKVKNSPTVDAVEVVHGEWIRCLDVDDVEYIECPICGGEFYDGDNDTFDKPYNYCPNCGAKMDGDGNVANE